MLFEDLQPKLRDAYNWTNKHTGGAPNILLLALKRFQYVRAAEGAASIAYYAIFSLFPLLLVLAGVLGFVLVSTPEPGQVVDFVTTVIPISEDFIRTNLVQILEQRGTVGIFGLVGLIWAASAVFITLARNINLAWPGAVTRNPIQGRLIGMAMLAVIAFLFVLSVLGATVFTLLPVTPAEAASRAALFENMLGSLLSALIPLLLSFLVFFAMYRWIPNIRVHWMEAFWGALFAALAWRLSVFLFKWYIYSGLVRLEVLYGSLATIILLLIWIYLTALITLLGAHISSAVAYTTRLREASTSQD